MTITLNTSLTEAITLDSQSLLTLSDVTRYRLEDEDDTSITQTLSRQIDTNTSIFANLSEAVSGISGNVTTESAQTGGLFGSLSEGVTGLITNNEPTVRDNNLHDVLLPWPEATITSNNGGSGLFGSLSESVSGIQASGVTISVISDNVIDRTAEPAIELTTTFTRPLTTFESIDGGDRIGVPLTRNTPDPTTDPADLYRVPTATFTNSGTIQTPIIFTTPPTSITIDDSHLSEDQDINAYEVTFADIKTGDGDDTIHLSGPELTNVGSTTGITFAANLDGGDDIGGSFTRGFTVFGNLGEQLSLAVRWEKIDTLEWTMTFQPPFGENGALGSVSPAVHTLLFNGDGSLQSINGEDITAVTVDITGVDNGRPLLSVPLEFDIADLTQFVGNYHVSRSDMERNDSFLYVPNDERPVYDVATNDGDDIVSISSAGYATATVNTGDGDDQIWVSENYFYNDLYFSNESLTAYAGDGDDFIGGSNGADKLYGENGDDGINGDGGEDRIYGGEGDDRLYGDEGYDRIWGGNDEDSISGGEGNDRLYGENDNDHIDGDEGDDRLYGGSGDDNLRGDEGDDRLYGDQGDDYLYGGDGYDRLYGGDGDDYLNGGNGADRLYAGDGDDTLYFDTRDTTIDGGNGNDTAYYDYWSGETTPEYRHLDIDSGTFKGIETVDLTIYNRGHEKGLGSVNIDINDILDMSDTDTLSLVITSDTTLAVENYTTVETIDTGIDQLSYTLYTNGDATLQVTSYNIDAILG